MEAITLSKTQKARLVWLKGLGLRTGIDFEIGGDGVFLYLLQEYIPWQSFADGEYRSFIEEMVRDNGAGEVFEFDAETKALLEEDTEDLHKTVYLSKEMENLMWFDEVLNDHIGSGGEDHVMEEVVAAQLEARIEPMIEALAQEVVMEPGASKEEPIFIITETGVVLSKSFCKEIALRTKEFFAEADEGEDIPTLLQRLCIEKWGESQRTFRAAFAVKLYAQAVMRSLQAQALLGNKLSVNQYWAV